MGVSNIDPYFRDIVPMNSQSLGRCGSWVSFAANKLGPNTSSEEIQMTISEKIGQYIFGKYIFGKYTFGKYIFGKYIFGKSKWSKDIFEIPVLQALPFERMFAN